MHTYCYIMCIYSHTPSTVRSTLSNSTTHVLCVHMLTHTHTVHTALSHINHTDRNSDPHSDTHILHTHIHTHPLLRQNQCVLLSTRHRLHLNTIEGEQVRAGCLRCKYQYVRTSILSYSTSILLTYHYTELHLVS